MLTWYVRVVAVALLVVGFFGFTITRIPNLVQLDLFQSFVYLILGAVGLKLGFSAVKPAALTRYCRVVGVVGFVLLALGITFPNLFDLFHLEIPEHLFHGVLGLASSIIGERKRKA